MYLILVTGVDSGYRPVPCGIPQGSRISEFEGAWEFPDSRISGSGDQLQSWGSWVNRGSPGVQ